jgi:hypothetical protein
MVNLKNNKKGVLLILVGIIITVITIVTSSYLSRLVTEKRSFTDERSVFQALSLAESAASLAYAELNKRFPSDLNSNLLTANANQLRPYVNGNNPLGFVKDYAHSGGTNKFSLAGSAAVLFISLPDYLNKGNDWNTTANITITSTVQPTKDSEEGPFRFSYRYKLSAQSRIWQGSGSDGIKGNADDKYVSKIISYAPNDFSVVARHDNFAKFALFTSHHRTPSGTTVWFTGDTNFYGPVHTNERFSFANNPSAHFTDAVSQHLPTVRFYDNGSSTLLQGNSNPLCCERDGCLATPCKDKPRFDGGFTMGADIINLPSSLSQTDLKNQALGTMSMPSSRGIYVPNQGGALTGGIFIYGNQGQSSDDAAVTMSVNASDDPVYTITQTRSGTVHTTVVTVDISANNTQVVVDGGSPTTYNGKPDGVGNEGIIIYSTDDIKDFSGTVQKNTHVTVSSERDLVITNHVRYEDYNSSPLNATGYDNILGILSWGGNVRISSSAPSNIEIHGIVMAHNGIFTVDDYNSGSPKGTATLLGGVITDFYGPFGTFSGGSMQSGYGRNFVYDARVLEGMAPPYFPYMTSYSSSVVPADMFRTRTSWREQES